MGRPPLALLLLGLASLPDDESAREGPQVASPPAADADARPELEPATRWTRGTWTAGLGATVGIPAGLTTLSAVARGGNYVITGLELGLEAEFSVFLWNTALTAQWREFAARLPTFAFRATPTLRYTPLRREAFAIYLLAGLGPTIFNRDGHVAGHWLVSPGMLIWLGGGVHLDLAFRFTSPFPRETCEAAFAVDTPEAGDSLHGYCDFRFGPHVGLVYSF